MKRALMVSTSTLLGLYGTLSYAPSQADSNLDLALGMGAVGQPSSSASDGTSASATAAGAASATATATAASPAATKSSSKPKPAKTSRKPKPAKTSSSPSASPTTPTPSDSGSASPAGPQDGDFTGTVERAGKYGVIEVQIRVVGGQLVDLGVLQYPSSDQESRDISGRSIPLLRAEALSAQSAGISAISGASFTSAAFIKSLTAALAKAGL